MSQWQHDYCLKVTEFVVAHYSHFEYVFQLRKVKRNQIMYLMDDRAEELYVIRKGSVRLTRIAEDGREELIEIRGDNEYFGALCLCPDYRWDHQATTHEDTLVATLKSSDFMRHFYGHEEMIKYFLGYYSKELATLTFEITDLKERFTLLRVVHYLYRQAQEISSQEAPLPEIKLVISPLVKTLSQSTGLEPATIESVMAGLKDMNILDWKRNSLTLRPAPLLALLDQLLYQDTRDTDSSENRKDIASPEES